MKKIALILGNGPSIDLLNPDLLKNFESFGTNHIYKKFNEWGRTTDNIVITDHFRLGEIKDAYKDFQGNLYVGDERYVSPPYNKIKKILKRDFVPLNQYVKESYPVCFFTRRIRWSRFLYTTVFDKARFTFDFNKGLNFGTSVVISSIQIAVILGFKRILLYGVDAKYNEPKAYFNSMKNEINYVNERFTSNPRLSMEPYLVTLQIYFEDMNIELIDCTPNGALKYIKKGNLEDFV